MGMFDLDALWPDSRKAVIDHSTDPVSCVEAIQQGSLLLTLKLAYCFLPIPVLAAKPSSNLGPTV